jgi:hypothetical protein
MGRMSGGLRTYISVESVYLSRGLELLVPLLDGSDELEPALSQLSLHLLTQSLFSYDIYKKLPYKLNGSDELW